MNQTLFISGFAWFCLLLGCWGRCVPTPAFPPFEMHQHSPLLMSMFENITTSLDSLVNGSNFNTSSFSVAVTSSASTLWDYHHTAADPNESRPGTKQVTGDSVYRIASISKVFTTLAILQQHVAGNLSLDDSIDTYLPEFKKVGNSGIHWKDISLRTLASQLSGIPREFSESDLMNLLPDPLAFGLPPLSKVGPIHCGEYSDFKIPCTRSDLMDTLRTRAPLFSPKQKSTYSNVNFDLLGLVVEKVSGLDYSTYVQEKILVPLSMMSTSLIKPDDEVAVLPKGPGSWDDDLGVENPSGGIYSSSNDLSKFVRYILTQYNNITSGSNWIHPQSFTYSMNTYYGMPWEIFRTTKILPHTPRSVTLVTKGGALPPYFSIIVVLPEYSCGFTILLGGDHSLMDKIRETITGPIIRTLEEASQTTLGVRYTGTYSSETNLNTSITISQTLSKGLYISQFISNGTNILEAWSPILAQWATGEPNYLQIIPTLLYRDEENQKGELWRMLAVSEEDEDSDKTWDSFCLTDDDPLLYGGKPFTEVVFWDREDGKVVELELTGFGVKLGLEHPRSSDLERIHRASSQKIPQDPILG